MIKTLSNYANKFTEIAKTQQDFWILAIRLTLGIIFIQTGWGKLSHLDMTTAFFTEIHIPMPYINAIIASSLEFFGGIAIILGLCTRLASLGLIFVMGVAIATAKWMEIVQITDLFGLQEWDYIVFFAILFSFGAGKLSLDRLFCKK